MRLIFMAFLLALLSGLINSSVLQAQADIPIIQNLDLDAVPPGQISRFWLHFIDDGLGRPVCVPILVARGQEPGPVLGLTAAIHGNELNGIPIIQQVFEQLDLDQLRGTLVGVPGLNAVSINLDQRRFVDEEDLNRNFPGKENGNRSQQYAYRIFDKIVRHFDFLVDMHTASFGRVNSLYVRADMSNDTIAEMARLQDADILLNSKGPSAGAAAGSNRALRTEAMLHGIPTITVEYGNPQVYQPDMIERGSRGVAQLMIWLEMQPGTPKAPPAATFCRKSYWIYTDQGGLLEIPVELQQKVKAGDVIGVLRNPFGDILQTYRAPEDGIVIGKSTNPVNMTGGRIIHLGIM